ncbi:M20 metallopeptidase family protein [Aestuariivirga sp. YIM B02566]|uniref:Amidohydrolase n=1 Tax=Taklimakanibacter albus TaxID=2800327 RepID=A0ACC5QXM3_9HYPH|nr:amidohydrolase [Aestuariivirga sp. YIM B02566]MBK1865141.1 amidohydrolase [Aestuariivirga sp. YIM B02566]
MQFRQDLLDHPQREHLLDIRRAIHAEPELSHQEFATSARVARELRRAGLDRFTPVGPIGFAVDIAGTGTGSARKIGIRADMDALPIHETAQVAFPSRRPGVMHACGHDSHTAMVLETALWLQHRRDRFAGTVRCLFQHSEETLPSGAREFVTAGLADDLDMVFGIHVDPMLPCGQIAAPAGPFACSSDHFDVVLSGRSAHGGRPHEGIDAIAGAVTFLQEANRISAHNADPMMPLVVTAGRISGGTAHNVIADRATIGGTIRAGGTQARDIAHLRLHEIAKGLETLHGVTASVTIREDAPLLSNDAGVAAIVREAAVKVCGDKAILSQSGMWSASDDFAYFSNVKPGTYFRLGVRNEAKGVVHPLHHPDFAIDEDALALGAAVLIQSALDALAA